MLETNVRTCSNIEVATFLQACPAANGTEFPQLDSFSVAENNTGTKLSPFDVANRL